ncbi:MAG TPA: pantoate--beta-alanine ligase [Solirubrobacteraceae bacterium]
MKTVDTVQALRAELAPARRRGETIGLVPTMGALHAGHLSLIAAARRRCDVVVVSLFVNPTQFNDPTDLTAYPRDAARDAGLAAAEGADLLFAPTVEEVYPDGFATTVSVSELTEGLEGAGRGPGHFDGVTTVVTKLFNMAMPDVAFFGQKDAQQALVIRRMVRDLNMPVRIEVRPTVRDSDGLALSSRNALLSPAQREQATALSRALAVVGEGIQAGGRDAGQLLAPARAELERNGLSPEYLELVAPDTLEPVTTVTGEVLAVIAARVGTTRLIDNFLIHPVAAAASAVADRDERP